MQTCMYMPSWYGKSWELSLLKHETSLHQFTSIYVQFTFILDNIFTHNDQISKTHVQNVQGPHFPRKQKPCGNAPQHRKGFVNDIIDLNQRKSHSWLSKISCHDLPYKHHTLLGLGAAGPTFTSYCESLTTLEFMRRLGLTYDDLLTPLERALLFTYMVMEGQINQGFLEIVPICHQLVAISD
jgi:hypothetical protein